MSHGVSVWALWEHCTSSEACSQTSLYAFQGNQKSADERLHGTRVCFSISPFGFLPETGEFPEEESGCATARRGTLTVSKDLSLATLGPTEIELHRCQIVFEDAFCDPDPSRVVTVAGRWTARSPASEQSDRYTFHVGECTERYSVRGAFREARARVTVDGDRLRRTNEAAIEKAMTKSRSCSNF
ncbi:MAG TPA: hypothetical protein VF660_05160 [Actinomycetota bacterium]